MTKQDFRRYIEVEILKCSSASKLSRIIKIFKLVHLNPSCCAIYYLRKLQYHVGKKNKISRFFAYRYHIKLIKEFGMHIAFDSEIGLGLHIPHPTSIVIGNNSIIGENCSIYQNCTIGGARVGDVRKGNQPTIGNNVIVFAGSMILGHVKVADNVVIGANSVLLEDAVEQGVYIGSPAKNNK